MPPSGTLLWSEVIIGFTATVRTLTEPLEASMDGEHHVMRSLSQSTILTCPRHYEFRPPQGCPSNTTTSGLCWVKPLCICCLQMRSHYTKWNVTSHCYQEIENCRCFMHVTSCLRVVREQKKGKKIVLFEHWWSDGCSSYGTLHPVIWLPKLAAMQL